MFLSTEDMPLFLWKGQTVPADSDQPCAGDLCRVDSGSLHPSGTVNARLCLDHIVGCLYTIDSFHVTSHPYRTPTWRAKQSFAPLTASYFYADCIK